MKVICGIFRFAEKKSVGLEIWDSKLDGNGVKGGMFEVKLTEKANGRGVLREREAREGAKGGRKGETIDHEWKYE